MTVTHHERARFFVESNGETFLCDLLCYGGNGACDCFPFKKYMRPEIDRAIAEGTFVPGPNTTCPHIERANQELLNHFKRELMKQFPDSDQERQP